MDNLAIAAVFEELADLLEFKGENLFRIRAYRNGAKAISELEEPVADILADTTRALDTIPGIGKTLEEKCRVLISTGSLPQLETLRKEFPASVLAMVRVPGVGPKKAARLHAELGIQSLDDLESACKQAKVRNLKGFGAKSEATILEGLAIARSSQLRMRWAEADHWMQQLLMHLRACPHVLRLEPAGSYRRGRETVGDLDILCVADNRDAVMDHFEKFPYRSETLLRGDEKKTKVSIRITDSFQVDLRLVENDQFGAALQYFTGSQAHNVHIRSLAKKKGLKVNEYGVFRDNETTSLTGSEESDVYQSLGLPWIPPELREDRQEFLWATSDEGLPTLVELQDIRGDLHMHTTATDGQNTLEEMCEAAIQKGLRYIAITDHSQRVAMARGLTPIRAREQWAAIAQIRKKYEDSLTILTGIECDILENGALDLPDDCLAEADWVVASIHYGQRQSREQITARIVGALEHPHVHCIAHPTGRLINRREAYEVDIATVIEAAARCGKLLELNANPARLDLNDLHCAAARNARVPIVISTDAHSIEGLECMRYGVMQARRGGLRKTDVANCWSWEQIKDYLANKG